MSKKEKYESLLPAAAALVGDERDMIANMANISALVHERMGFQWTGFYIVRGEELVLGPFQGHPACIRIRRGRGVCGSSWERQETLVVDDVFEFPGYIACSGETQSEIVVPVWKGGEVIAVLDIDSEKKCTFDAEDAKALEELVKLFDR